MDNNYTDITIIVDRSDSMADNGFNLEMEKGLELFLTEQAQDTSNKCLVTLVEFDSAYGIVYANRSIQDVPRYMLVPRSATALLDAVGRTIKERGEYFASLPECDRPAKVLVLIITDGGENSSRSYNFGQVKEMIDRQKNVYNWEFVFLGAGLESFADAHAVNIKTSNLGNYSKDAFGSIQMFADVSRSVAKYRTMSADQYVTQVQNEEKGFFQVEE